MTQQTWDAPSEQSAKTKGYTTLDIVLVAVIGVVFGIVNAGFGIIYQFGIATFGPVWTAVFLPFNISQVLAMYIIRKPGVALANGLINGLVQFLAGNPAGVVTLFWGALQGLGVEIPFLATRYRNYSLWVFFVGGGLATCLAKIVNVVIYGWGALGPGVLVPIWIGAFFSSGIASGLVGYAIGKLLLNTGVLRSYRAARPAAA